MFVLLLLVVTLVSPTPLNTFPPPDPCEFPLSVKNNNLPANTTDKEHEIIHGTAVLDNGKLTRWLFQTRNGGTWEAQVVKDARLGAIGPVQAVEPFGANLTFKGCY